MLEINNDNFEYVEDPQNFEMNKLLNRVWYIECWNTNKNAETDWKSKILKCGKCN